MDVGETVLVADEVEVRVDDEVEDGLLDTEEVEVDVDEAEIELVVEEVIEGELVTDAQAETDIDADDDFDDVEVGEFVEVDVADAVDVALDVFDAKAVVDDVADAVFELVALDVTVADEDVVDVDETEFDRLGVCDTLGVDVNTEKQSTTARILLLPRSATTTELIFIARLLEKLNAIASGALKVAPIAGE